MKIWSLFLTVAIGMPFISYGQDAEPPYGRSHLEAYSIFTDAIKNDDHEMALMYGLWMLEAKPREMPEVNSFRLDRQFERLIDVYTSMAADEADPTKKSGYLGEADNIFDLAFETFEDGEIDIYRWYQKRGRFYQEHHNYLDAELSDAFEWYENAYRMDPETFVTSSDGYFIRILLSHLLNNGDRDKAMSMIDEAEEMADAGLQEELDEFREQLFESPEERIAFIESRLDDSEGEERQAMLQSLVNLYDETGQRDKAVETARKLYQINPDFKNTRRIADIHITEGEYEASIPYLEELLDLSSGEEQSAAILLELSETYRQLGDLQTAREHARRAVSLGNRGEGNLSISAIYASAISRCTGGQALERDDRTVYWLVLDYLEKALEADSALRSTVDRRVQTYREAMPSVQDKFFREWEEGDSFRIDESVRECYAWIDEQTRVR